MFSWHFALLAAACGDDDSGEATTPLTAAATSPPAAATTPAAPAALRVGMALPGPKNDQGFSQAHYDGLLLIEQQFGQRSRCVRTSLTQALVESLRDLAPDNDIVIGVGAMFGEAGVTVAAQFPEVSFIIVNGVPGTPNLYVYGVREGVPAYIAGVVAAQFSEAGKGGFVGGLEIPPMFLANDAFAAGLASEIPGASVASAVVGSFATPKGRVPSRRRK